MRYFILLAVTLIGALLWTLPAKAQDCIAPEATIKQLDEYTKANSITAQAWLWQSDAPGVKLLIIWFSNVPSAVVISAFHNDCLVVMPSNGRSTQVMPIDGDIQKAVGAAELLFDNGVRDSPFTTF